MKKVLALDIKYSLTQILYFGAFAGLLGYATNYLTSKGITTSLVGITLSIVSVIAVFTQPAIAQFADKNKQIPLKTLCFVVTVVSVGLGILMTVINKIPMITLLVFASLAVFLQTIMPLLNSLPFAFKKYGIEVNFGIARGLGSAAYAFISLGIGNLIEMFNTDIIPWTYIILLLLLAIVCYVYDIPEKMKQEVEIEEEETKDESKQLSFMQFFAKYKKFMIFVAGLILVYFTHTIINNFMIKVVEPIGGDASQMGTAVFIAAMSELPAMFGFNALRNKLGTTNLLKISVIMFAVKHALTLFAGNITIFYIAQFTQALAYAPLIPASVYYVNQIIDESDAIKGQSMVTMAFTASGIFANLLGGIMIDAMGMHSVLMVGLVISVVGLLIVFSGLEKVH